jgi:ribosomal protein S19E (S16A)
VKTTLTPFERRALEIVRDIGPVRNISAIGFKLFEGEQDNRKRNPSPQGMALAAGRFMYPLEKKGLIGHGREGRYITPAGLEVLRKS